MGPHLPSSCSDQGPSWGTLTTTTVTAPEARTQGPAAPGLGLNAELGPRHNRLSLFSPNVPGPCAAWAAGAVGPFPPLSAAVAHTCEGAGRGLWSRETRRPDSGATRGRGGTRRCWLLRPPNAARPSEAPRRRLRRRATQARSSRRAAFAAQRWPPPGRQPSAVCLCPPSPPRRGPCSQPAGSPRSSTVNSANAETKAPRPTRRPKCASQVVYGLHGNGALPGTPEVPGGDGKEVRGPPSRIRVRLGVYRGDGR